MTLDNIRIHWLDIVSGKWENAIWLERITNLKVQEIITRQPHIKSDHGAFVLSNVQSAQINNCIALPGTGTVFDIGGEETRHIQLKHNHLLQAKKPLKFQSKEVKEQVEVIS